MTAVDRYMESCASRKFSWGKWDCALFCADVIEAITGHDPARQLRGTYSDQQGAIEALALRGVEGVGGLPEWAGLSSVDAPRDGDIVIAKRNQFTICGVWHKGHAWNPAHNGVRRIPPGCIQSYWRP
jgi:hypothetical protein